MLGSLYSGISGIKTHLVRLDVSSNNIANINTIGFKAGRVTFAEALTRLLHRESKPTAEWGGINPIQIGTGVKIASIDNIFTQGGLETTGNVLDLAIEGDGFFIVEDQYDRRHYTRAGIFRLDGMGRLVTPNGYILQGRIAVNGKIPPGAPSQDIVIPVTEKIPAKQTTRVNFACNLNMEEKPKATLMKTGAILADALPTDEVDGLYSYMGARILLTPSDYVVFSLTTSLGNEYSVTLSYDPVSDGTPNDMRFNTLQGLAEELQSFLNTLPDGTHALDTVSVMSGAGAGLETFIRWNNTDPVTRASFTSTNGFLENSFSNYNGGIAPGNVDSENFLHTATEIDPLVDIYSQRGDWLDLSVGDNLIFSGKTGSTDVYTTHIIAPGDTLGSLCQWIENDFQISTGNAYIDNEGRLIVEGDPGTDDALQITIVEPANPIFNGWIGTLPVVQQATDVIYTTSFVVYDSLGMPHTITMSIKKDDIVDNMWHWSTKIDIGTIREGGSGDITFNADGSLSVFTYAGGASAFKFSPETGATEPVVIDFFAGTPGKFDGITQMKGPSTTVAVSQDGYPMGTLESLSVSRNGEIVGSFSNGILKTLAQITLAKFVNPQGLIKEGDTLWAESLNSGMPTEGAAGEILPFTSILSGYLEQSNVDLAKEFIELIIAERGLQASSRVVTTGDRILGEVVGLKR